MNDVQKKFDMIKKIIFFILASILETLLLFWSLTYLFFGGIIALKSMSISSSSFYVCLSLSLSNSWLMLFSYEDEIKSKAIHAWQYLIGCSFAVFLGHALNIKFEVSSAKYYFIEIPIIILYSILFYKGIEKKHKKIGKNVKQK